MVLDIDNFKQINDNRGHLEGDKILRKVSQILVSTFRDEDVVGRLGGDEFLVFVKGAIKKNAFSSQKISAGQRGFGYGKYRNNSCKQE